MDHLTPDDTREHRPVEVKHYYDEAEDREVWCFVCACGHKRTVYDPCQARALMHTMPSLM